MSAEILTVTVSHKKEAKWGYVWGLISSLSLRYNCEFFVCFPVSRFGMTFHLICLMELTQQMTLIFVNLKLQICISFCATLVLINVPKFFLHSLARATAIFSRGVWHFCMNILIIPPR